MANGFFQGGFAQGADQARARSQTDRELGIRRSALGLQERQEERAARNDLIERTNTAINESLKVISETIRNGKLAGVPNEKLLKLIKGTAVPAAQMAQTIGQDSRRIESVIQSELLAPTPVEKATTKGKSEATAKLTEAKTIAKDLGLQGQEAEDFVRNFAGDGGLQDQGDTSTDLVDRSGSVPVLKNEVTNTVRGTVASVFGGVFNPITGEISGLSKEEGRQVLDIQARAEELLLREDEVTVGGAVKRAIAEQDKARQEDAKARKVPGPKAISNMTTAEAKAVLDAIPPDVELTAEQTDAFRKKLRSRNIETITEDDDFVGGS